ncbi:hypothetical protein [Brevibacillus dissolubilis]|uniref:hypothetical protein n=1 Tax=Brevibacillus dissolubilis TaxID=1844116 RepID=UPI001116023D|nr:hypothetical protein [Brevibacillus dissolubilis]
MEVLVYRNIEGRVEPSQLDRWMTKALELGLTIVEETQGQTMTVTLVQGDEMVGLRFYGGGTTYRTRIDYLRIELGETPWEECLDSLIMLASLSGEKHVITDGRRIPTYFEKGTEKATGKQTEAGTSFELMLMKETMQGNLNLSLDQYRAAKARGDLELQEKATAQMKTCLAEIQWLEQQIRAMK